MYQIPTYWSISLHEEIRHILLVTPGKGCVPIQKTIKEYMKEAQMITMQEITYKVIVLNNDVYSRFVGRGLCNPKNLSHFTSGPENVLHAMYGEDVGELPADKHKEEEVETWCQKANQYVGKFPWLETIEKQLEGSDMI